MNTSKLLVRIIFLILGFLLFLTACGGGGGGGTPTPGSNEVTITPAGGTYTLQNGIVLNVPAGAVTQDTQISIELVDEQTVQPILDRYDSGNKTFLTAFRVRPYGLKFNLPVEITFPKTSPIDTSSVPMMFVVDIANNLSAPHKTPNATSSSSPRRASSSTADAVDAFFLAGCTDKTVTYRWEDFRDAFLDYLLNSGQYTFDEAVYVVDIVSKRLPESDCVGETACRCCGMSIVVQETDISGVDGSGSCYNAGSQGSITYTECPGSPVESWSEEETSGKVVLSPTSLNIAIGEAPVVTVQVLDKDNVQLTNYAIKHIESSNAAVASYDSMEAGTFRVIGKSPGSASLTIYVNCEISAKLSVTVRPIPIITSADTVGVPEGGTNTFEIKLGEAPPEGITVELSIIRVSGDADLTNESGLFTFDSTNWDVFQTATLAAAEDDDVVNGTAAFLIAIPIGSSSLPWVEEKQITANEVDNDVLQFVTDKETVIVPEQGSNALHVKLSQEPPQTVSVTVARVSGDADIMVSAGSSLTFDANDWSTYKTVTLAAAADDDCTDGSAAIRLGDTDALVVPKDVSAKEKDVDVCSLIITPANLCVEKGRSAKFSVIATGPIDLNSVVWSSGNPNIVSVDGTGLVNALGNGSASITAEAEMDGAQVIAAANVMVRDNCVEISSPSESYDLRSNPPGGCIQAKVNNKDTGASGMPLVAEIKTPQPGHQISWWSSDTLVADIDASGNVMAGNLGGAATIYVSVDNVVTTYHNDVPMTVKRIPDDYKTLWLNQTTDVRFFLTKKRNVLSYEEAAAQATSDLTSCDLGSVAEEATLTDFNSRHQYLGYYYPPGAMSSQSLFFDFNTCYLTNFPFPPLGMLHYPYAAPWGDSTGVVGKALNDEGYVVGEIVYQTNATDGGTIDTYEGMVWREGSYLGLVPDVGFTDINNSGTILGYWDDGTATVAGVEWFLADAESRTVKEWLDEVFDRNTNPRDLNDNDWVAGEGYFQGNGLSFHIWPTFPNGSPVPTSPGFWNISNTQDILGSYRYGTQEDWYVLYLCPFNVKTTNVCEWIKPEDRPEAIKGYTSEDTTCDGVDNDCDHVIDDDVVPTPTTCGIGACLSVGLNECVDGKMVDSCTPGVPSPEVCDGIDNNCDGTVDEGCP